MTSTIYEHKVSQQEKEKYLLFKKRSPAQNITISNPSIISTAISGETHYKKLKELIDKAKHNIKLATFIFDDIKTAELLIKASKKLKGGVYVLTSIIDDKIRRDYGYSKDDQNNHLEVLKLLDDSPVAVRCVDGLHAKFWLFDDKVSVVTSSNLTTNSLNYVPELGILCTKKDIVNTLNYEFRDLWLNYASKEMKNGRLSRIEIRPYPSSLQRPEGGQSLVFFRKLQFGNTQSSDDSWFQKFHSIIEHTRDELLISSFSLDFSSEEVTNILVERMENNVNVKLMVAEASYKRNTDFGDWCLGMEKAYPDNFEFIIHPRNHTKFIISDKKHVLISTKNYERKNKYPSSYEIGICKDEVAEELIKIWDKLVAEAHHTYYVYNKQDYYHELSDLMKLSVYENDVRIRIWHQQAPVYGYFHSLTLREISRSISKAKHLTLILGKGKKIIKINHYLKLHINDRDEIYKLDETSKVASISAMES